MPRFKTKQGVKMDKVPADQAKIVFKIELVCEWDWNRDIASTDYEGDECFLKYSAQNNPELRKAFVQAVAHRLDDMHDRLFCFSTRKVTVTEGSPACELAYAKYHDALTGADRKQAEQELADVQAREKALKAKLGMVG